MTTHWMIGESLSPQSYASGRLAGKAEKLCERKPVGQKTRAGPRDRQSFRATLSADQSFLFSFKFSLSGRAERSEKPKRLRRRWGAARRPLPEKRPLSAAIVRTRSPRV